MNASSKLTRLIATGALSYMTANVVHHVIGHSGAALLAGNKIELLSAAYFKSKPTLCLITYVTCKRLGVMNRGLPEIEHI